MCKGECKDCIYYFEDTDFCLKTMYSAKNTGGNCPDWKNKADYPATTLISDEDLDFSYELTDCRDEDMTIYELYQELKAINDEYLDY